MLERKPVKITVNQGSQQQPQSPTHSGINLVLGADSLLVLVGLFWFTWEKFIKSKVVNKLDSAFTPVEEERKLGCILAQVGLITKASRVILTAFHNGQITNYGYHLTKVSTINNYVAPGASPMAKPIRDLPLGRIMYELEELMRAKDKEYTVTVFHDELPQPCKDHLTSNQIGRMYNRLVRIGNLPIGILSVQYHDTKDMDEFIYNEPYHTLLNKLYEDIAAVMRRRVVHPNKLKQIIMMMIRGGK